MITSLLDNDFYAFTMANAIHTAGTHNLPVIYEFRNRNFAVPLAHRIKLDQLRDRIEQIRELQFTYAEIQFLRDQGLFTDDFLKHLLTIELPPVHVNSDNGHLTMTYGGSWISGIFWESMLLATVNEMYYSRFGGFMEEGEKRLHEKIAYLQDRKTIKFVEFGTRRRFSSGWQHFVTRVLKDEIPDLLLGTSNVKLAKDLELTPYGTMAHQLFMVYTAHNKAVGTEDPITAGANDVMDMWLACYRDNPRMLTLLPDTYTTKTFSLKADPNLISQFQAFRQDSGDPMEIGQRLSYMAQALGHSKPKIMFSDSLDVRKMSVIEDFFDGSIQMVSGWGTNLTNDLGYEPLSIVIKPAGVKVGPDWEPCVKLSDDLQKVTGKTTQWYRAQL